MDDIEQLTADQQQVVAAGLGDRTLVLAGPGTGKTHSLVVRIATLITRSDQLSHQDVLSLSFSRAAVGELRKRLSTLPGRGSRVHSNTFDSYAARLLYLYGDDSWQGAGYDQRIRLATELVTSGLAREVSEIRHVFVDEAQDLLGERSSFVLALLDVAPGGFTIFADPAQAIYDFTSREDTGPTFTEQLIDHYSDVLLRFSLTVNHRTTDTRLLGITGLGQLLRPPEAVSGEAVRELEAAVHRLPTAGAIEDVAPLLHDAHATAVLTRRNSEALAVSEALSRANVDHDFRRRADDPVIGVWLSQLQASLGRDRLTREDLECIEDGLPWSAESTWTVLSRIAPVKKGMISLTRLAQSLATMPPPDELVDTGTSGVVISSIHRAKGLEFETVFLIPFEIGTHDWQQEARILYVGLTRAKSNLLILKSVDDGRWRYEKWAARWTRIAYAGKHPRTTAVELVGSDTWTFEPTGRVPPQVADTGPLINHLHQSVRPGDSVTLVRRASAAADPAECVYDVIHRQTWVAATTPLFGEVVTKRLGLRSPPSELTGARVECVATMALPEQVADTFGLSGQLVPNLRLRGIGAWE